MRTVLIGAQHTRRLWTHCRQIENCPETTICKIEPLLKHVPRYFPERDFWGVMGGFQTNAFTRHHLRAEGDGEGFPQLRVRLGGPPQIEVLPDMSDRRPRFDGRFGKRREEWQLATILPKDCGDQVAFRMTIFAGAAPAAKGEPGICMRAPVVESMEKTRTSLLGSTLVAKR